MIKVMTALKGYIWEDWVSIHYDELKTLPLPNFLERFKDAFMPTEWETDVCIQLNTMSQSKNQTFHDCSTAIRNKNSLLCGTDFYLNDTKLCNHIEVGMDLTLARCTRAHDKKLHLIVGFQPWLDAIKELNIDLQAECVEHCTELEVMMKSLCLKSHDNCTLSEPSRKYNSINPLSTKVCHSIEHTFPPKLTPDEGSLLINNHGCTKCRKAYIFHTKFDCPNDFPKLSPKLPLILLDVFTNLCQRSQLVPSQPHL